MDILQILSNLENPLRYRKEIGPYLAHIEAEIQKGDYSLLIKDLQLVANQKLYEDYPLLMFSLISISSRHLSVCREYRRNLIIAAKQYYSNTSPQSVEYAFQGIDPDE